MRVHLRLHKGQWLQPWLYATGILLLLLPHCLHAQNTKLIVQTGSNIIVTGSNLVLNSTDVQADGLLDATNGSLVITGSSNSSLLGATPILLGPVTLNTSPLSTLTLNNTLHVSGPFTFFNGLVNLNGNVLQLSGAGALSGESESSRITDPGNGSVVVTVPAVTNPFQLNAGNLGAAISSTANIGNLTISRLGKAATNPANTTLHGIQRIYFIQPQNNTALNATLRFNYLNAELNGDDPNTLSLWKSADGITWTNVGADTRNPAGKYVEKSGINDFSMWTLSDLLNALPLTLVSFSAKCASGYTQLQWHTGTESGMDRFEVERSTDGTKWTKLSSVKTTNSSNGASYSYDDNNASASAMYRLKIFSQSGTFVYSPVFRGGCADIAMPLAVYPNPSSREAIARLSVRESSTAVIKIVDNAGKIVFTANWKLQAGINAFNLPVASIASGTYFIQVTTGGSTLQTTLLKQ
jgi:hypothetical protein